MKAIIFGAGNIGRGFIGQLLSESGYEVTFVDVDAELVAELNRRGEYHLQTVLHDEVADYRIGPVRAIDGNDGDAVSQAVLAADIGATAVGAGALKYISPGLVAGGILRAEARSKPLDIILCENLKGASAHMRELIRPLVPEEHRDFFEKKIGFVDTVIGRMVPAPTPEMRAEDVSFIRVEPYKELPVDRLGFTGEIPRIVAMEAHENFGLFTARKLYVHNCGHALLAYVGYLHGYEFGYEAMKDPEVRRVLDGGLRESVSGIVSKFAADRQWLESNVDDLMHRFGNQVLGDTIFRLGRDPVRKLQPTDRLVGAAKLVSGTVGVPRFLAWGIAAALCFDPAGDPVAVELQEKIRVNGVQVVLAEVANIGSESDLGKLVFDFYCLLKENPQEHFPG